MVDFKRGLKIVRFLQLGMDSSRDVCVVVVKSIFGNLFSFHSHIHKQIAGEREGHEELLHFYRLLCFARQFIITEIIYCRNKIVLFSVVYNLRAVYCYIIINVCFVSRLFTLTTHKRVI